MSSARKIRCSVASIVDHGDRVYTLDLATETPVPSFRPGQFLHLTAEAYDPASFWPDSRVFSIASPPRDRHRLRICYSVKGRYTTRMEQTLRVGGAAWIKLPFGDFVIDGSHEVVLIAGGTGISAFTAFLEALPPAHPHRVTLLYGARTPDLWLFRDMLERQLAACPSFSVLFFAESGLRAMTADSCPLASERPSTGLCPPSLICCRSGCLSLDHVLGPLSSDGRSSGDCRPVTAGRPLTAEFRPLSGAGPSSVVCSPLAVSPSSVFYLSGPPAMLKTLTAELKSRGISKDRIRTDAWE